MKTFSLSEKDIKYITPLDSVLSAMNVAIQVYVVNTVYKRLSIEPTARGRYDLDKGQLFIEEASDKVQSAMPPKGTGTPPQAEPKIIEEVKKPNGEVKVEEKK